MLYDLTYLWNLKKKKNFLSQTHRNRVEWQLPRAGEWGKWGDAGQKVQAFSYKMNKF